MNDELMRRISDALDAPGGLEANEDLRAQLEADPLAAAYASDLGSIDAALSKLGHERDEPDWEAMVSRIDERLDEELEDIGDVTAEPVLEDDEKFVELPAEPVNVAAAAAPTAVAKPETEGKVVDLAERRRRRSLFAALGGLAAAAAVGLGIMVGLEVNSDAEPMAASAVMSPEAEEAAPAPMAAAEAMAEMEGAEGDSPDWDSTGSATDEQAAIGAMAPGAWDPSPESEPPTEASATPSPAPPASRAVARRTRGRSATGARGGGGGGYVVGGLLEDSLGGGSTGSGGAGRAGAGSSSQPNRAQVVNILQGAERGIRTCMGEERAEARVTVVVRGGTGTVESVTIAPPFDTGSRGQCMARQIRRLRMPTSSTATYTVTHVYRPERIAGGSMGQPANAARARQHRRPASPPAREQRAPSSEILDAFSE